MVDPRFERSVRRWLWAYPRRWRVVRAEEVIGTLADLAPPGATRLDARSGLGLVVHGVATRRRMGPPLRYRLRYGFGGTPPWQYRGWVADGIASPFYRSSSYVLLFCIFVIPAFGRVATRQSSGGELAFWAVYLAAGRLVPLTRARREAASRHLVRRPGDTPTPWDHQSGWVYRDRLSARSVLTPAGWAIAVLTAGAAVPTLVGRSGPVIGLAWCFGVGLALAVRLGVRWRRRVPAKPDQPARRMLVASRQHVATTWCSAAMCLGFAVPWTVPFGLPEEATFFGPVVLGAALVVLPVLVVAARLSARGPADIAAIDVLRLVVRRGPLRVDTLQRGVVPAWFESVVPEGLGYAPPPPPTTATA